MVHIPEGYYHTVWHFAHPGGSGHGVFTCGFEKADLITESDWHDYSESAAQQLMVEFDPSQFIFQSDAYYRTSAGLFKIEASLATGSGSAHALTVPSASVLVRKLSATVGRHAQGRMFLPAPAESQVDETGRLSSSAVTAYQGAVDDWLASITSHLAIGAPVVLHSDASLGAPSPITALQVQSMAATQRRRMRP